MKEWREEIAEMMDHAGCFRRPSLRRSNREEYLLSTDYPQAADPDAAQALIRAARSKGWKILQEDGWIYFDRPAVFEAADGAPHACPEADCCLSLLERHPDARVPSDGKAERMLLKAMEEGNEAFETVCKKLHGIMACSLRKKERIHDIDQRFFGGKG